MQAYKTIAECGTAFYEIQKSKFYTYTAPVADEAAAREFVQGIKKKHFDARHNCSAWVLGDDSSQQKSNDDGEPGGTAGNRFPVSAATSGNPFQTGPGPPRRRG